MPIVHLGKGVNVLNAQTHAGTIFENLEAVVQKNKNVKPTRNSTLTAKVVTSSSKLYEGLKASLGISAGSPGVAGTAQANFLKEISANVFDMFYVFEFTEELYTEFLPDGLQVKPIVQKYFDDYKADKFIKVKAFCDHYGNVCVDSIVYGRKIILVAQINRRSHHKFLEKGANVGLSFAGDIAKGDAEAAKALNSLKSDDVENVYYYVSDSNDPHKVLTTSIGDLKRVTDLILNFNKKNGKPSAVTNDGENVKKEEGSGASHANKGVDGQGGKKEEKEDLSRDAASHSGDLAHAIKNLVQVRYTTVPYSQWLGSSWAVYILEENISDIKNLLGFIYSIKQKIIAFKDAIDLAMLNTDKLAFNEKRGDELKDCMAKLNAMLNVVENHESFFIRQWFLLYIRSEGEAYNLQKRLETLNDLVRGELIFRRMKSGQYIDIPDSLRNNLSVIYI